MEREIRRAIGVRLRKIRVAAKFTQDDVALDFALSRQAISSWETGRTLPGLLEFRALATLYGVSSDLLLYGVDNVEAASKGVLARVQAAASCAR